MSRTGWSVAVAGLLVAGSVGLAVHRRYVLGDDIAGPPAARTWRVSLVATGDLTLQDQSVTVALPPDFRQQHILEEHFDSSKELAPPRTGKERDRGRREAVYRRTAGAGKQPYRLTYSFRVQTGVCRPSAAMAALTQELDAPPAGPVTLQASSRIESEAPEIRQKAFDLVTAAADEGKTETSDLVKALFDFVSDTRNIRTDPSVDVKSARECLTERRGDSGAKARLLVALCRNRGIPARLVSGLALAAGQDQPLHHWAEAWVNQRWLPMDPTRHHYGVLKMDNYLVLHLGDEDVIRSRRPPQFGFAVQNLRHAAGAGEEPSALRDFWQGVSLNRLPPAEHRLVRFLLLLPLGALIVSVCRTVVGVPTYGTFSPALLGLAFLDLSALHWGLAIFVAIVLCGWLMRHLLEAFHLIQVPRTSALLTLIVMLLIAVVVYAAHAEIVATRYISLFPLVILTHLVERFWTVEAEDGTTSSFKTLAGTVFVAAAVSFSLAPRAVTAWMFQYPETLGVVLAAQFLLGRYTGYRLVELYRFGDLLTVEGPDPAHVAAAPSANGDAHAGGPPAPVGGEARGDGR
jgi:hypothetical protein